MNKITPFLWFNDQAGPAADFYLSIFPNSRKLNELRSPVQTSVRPEEILTVTIELEGQQVTFLNGGTAQQLSPAFSFSVICETQAEIDDYWAKLTPGGEEIRCGWLTDKFGVSWQIVPAGIAEMIRHPNAMQAMMKMNKLDIATLKAAAKE
jgi:predicted 3-demethylubiquinone-9 3-methyltransferase (glyoxalase superfamily)